MSNLADVMERFHRFDDALLERIVIDFPNRQKYGTAEIVLLAEDSTSLGSSAWCRVNIRLAEASEFHLTESSRCYNRVLSSGLQAPCLDGKVWIILGEDESISSAEQARRASFYFCGTRVDVQIAPFSSI